MSETAFPEKYHIGRGWMGCTAGHCGLIPQGLLGVGGWAGPATAAEEAFLASHPDIVQRIFVPPRQSSSAHFPPVLTPPPYVQLDEAREVGEVCGSGEGFDLADPAGPLVHARLTMQSAVDYALSQLPEDDPDTLQAKACAKVLLLFSWPLFSWVEY